jgi:hypothetical protein
VRGFGRPAQPLNRIGHVLAPGDRGGLHLHPRWLCMGPPRRGPGPCRPPCLT